LNTTCHSRNPSCAAQHRRVLSSRRIVHDSIAYCSHQSGGRLKTVTLEHVLCALRKNGRALYSFDGSNSRNSTNHEKEGEEEAKGDKSASSPSPIIVITRHGERADGDFPPPTGTTTGEDASSHNYCRAAIIPTTRQR